MKTKLFGWILIYDTNII